MVNFFECESLARILDPAHNRLSRANIRDFNVLARIEISSMLDDIDQHFAKSGCDIFPFRSGKSVISRKNWINLSAVCLSQRAMMLIQSGVADTSSIPSSQGAMSWRSARSRPRRQSRMASRSSRRQTNDGLVFAAGIWFAAFEPGFTELASACP